MDVNWTDDAPPIPEREPKFPYTHFLLRGGVAPTGTFASPALSALIQALDVDLLKGRLAALVKLLNDSETQADHQNIRNAFAGGDEPVAPVKFHIKDVHAGLVPGDNIAIVIDDGALFAHERLRTAAGKPRVAWVWIQDADTDRTADPTSSVPFGRELFPEEINDLIQNQKLDEETLYRQVGLIDMARAEPRSAAARYSHGLAVTDMLAGQAPGDRALDHLHILMVSLPTPLTWDTSGAYIAKFILAGVEFALARAQGMINAADDLNNGDVTVTLNLSYGLAAGPKDGSGIFERYLNSRVQAWRKNGGKISCFAPMGNTRLTQSHARLHKSNAGTSLRWVIPPDDPTPNFLEIWSEPREARGSPRLGLSLAVPGQPLQRVEPAASFDRFRDLRSSKEARGPIARLYHSWHAPVDGGIFGREVLTLAIQPTVPRDGNAPFAPPGHWLIVVNSEDEAVWPVDLFVQRDDSLPGYARRGRQSWLEDDSYARRDASGRLITEDPANPGLVQRAGTYNALASNAEVTLVGGSRLTSSGDAIGDASFSALGFVDAGVGRRAGPDVMKPADGPATSPGLVGAGARSGSRVALRGTSFAAPRAARDEILGPRAQFGLGKLHPF